VMGSLAIRDYQLLRGQRALILLLQSQNPHAPKALPSHFP
jgi:hypothetical protein